MDRVAELISLPELNIGDWLAFENMGAYSFVLATTFNGMPNLQIHSIVKKSTW
jgi:ornithine decarboxylase